MDRVRQPPRRRMSAQRDCFSCSTNAAKACLASENVASGKSARNALMVSASFPEAAARRTASETGRPDSRPTFGSSGDQLPQSSPRRKKPPFLALQAAREATLKAHLEVLTAPALRRNRDGAAQLLRHDRRRCRVSDDRTWTMVEREIAVHLVHRAGALALEQEPTARALSWNRATQHVRVRNRVDRTNHLAGWERVPNHAAPPERGWR